MTYTNWISPLVEVYLSANMSDQEEEDSVTHILATFGHDDLNFGIATWDMSA
jgi:hypothetical protein